MIIFRNISWVTGIALGILCSFMSGSFERWLPVGLLVANGIIFHDLAKSLESRGKTGKDPTEAPQVNQALFATA